MGITDSISSAVRKLAGGGADPKKYFNTAIIAMAGSGLRAGEGKAKQLRMLDGMPVGVRTLMTFEACPFINAIVIAAREEDINTAVGWIGEYGLTKVKRVVKGADTRQGSVLEAFKAIPDETDYVYIHDGARCLVTIEMIERVGRSACVHGAASAACRIADTVKEEDGGGYISSTADRARMWLAQTPQVFRTELYRAGAYYGLSQNLSVTDDNMLAENIGYKVKLVDCGRTNIKITLPEDFAIAEAILRFRGEDGEENK